MRSVFTSSEVRIILRITTLCAPAFLLRLTCIYNGNAVINFLAFSLKRRKLPKACSVANGGASKQMNTAVTFVLLGQSVRRGGQSWRIVSTEFYKNWPIGADQKTYGQTATSQPLLRIRFLVWWQKTLQHETALKNSEQKRNKSFEN